MDTDAGGWASSGCPVFSVEEETRPKLKVMVREEVTVLVKREEVECEDYIYCSKDLFP